MKKTYIAFSMMMCGFMTVPVLADSKSGADLFKYHGCINCHGAEAKNPVSKVVPKLAGKPADELLDNAKKILSGESTKKNSEVMHAAFYSPSSCDMPPTDAELEIITVWISEQEA